MLAPLTIGHVRLANNLLLAPIAGYCDVSYRLIVRSFGGVGLACTDLLSPEGILRKTPNTMVLTATCDEDKPLAMQLYGGVTDRLCEAARWAEDNGADIVDINMGCPVDKVTKKDGGSKLLCDPDKTLRMVEKVKAALRRCPLTCKLRLGWDDSCIVAPAMVARLEDAGVSLVTIHGRTTEMRFSGQARLDGIAEVVAAVKRIPVIGNGDIRTPQDAEHMLRYTKCAGVMIGRGALSAPWIFRDTAAYLTTGVIPPSPTIEEKVAAMRRHFYNICQYRNERSAIMELRKRVSWYAKTMHPCSVLKEKVRLINSVAEFEAALTEFLEWRAERDRAKETSAEPMEELAEVA